MVNRKFTSHMNCMIATPKWSLARVIVVQVAKLTHRRYRLKTVAKALYPSTFVIDRDDQSRIA